MARAEDVPAEALVREAAGALAEFAGDPTELLTACRQLLRRRPGCGPLVWLAARMLTGADPVQESRDTAEAVVADPTAAELAAVLPADGHVLVIGSPDNIGRALLRRPDVEVMVADAAGEGLGLLQELRRLDHVCTDVPDWGVGAAAASSDLVLIEAEAAGPGGAYARSGSRAAAAVASDVGIDVWVVAGVGRFMPMRMWQAMLEMSAVAEPWLHDIEFVPLTDVDSVCGRSGRGRVAEAILATDCPVVPELFR